MIKRKQIILQDLFRYYQAPPVLAQKTFKPLQFGNTTLKTTKEAVAGEKQVTGKNQAVKEKEADSYIPTTPTEKKLAQLLGDDPVKPNRRLAIQPPPVKPDSKTPKPPVAAGGATPNLSHPSADQKGAPALPTGGPPSQTPPLPSRKNRGPSHQPQLAKATPSTRSSSQSPARPLAEGKNPPPSLVSVRVYVDKGAIPFERNPISFIAPQKLPTAQQPQQQNSGSPLKKQVQAQTTSKQPENTVNQKGAAVVQQAAHSKTLPPEALQKLGNIAQNIQDLRNMSLPTQQLKQLVLQIKKMIQSLEGVKAFSEATGIPAEELQAFLQAAQGGKLPSHLKGVPFQIFAKLGLFVGPVPLEQMLEDLKDLENQAEVNKLATQYRAAKKAEEEKKAEKENLRRRGLQVRESQSTGTDPNAEQEDTAANAKETQLLSESNEDLESKKRTMGFM